MIVLAGLAALAAFLLFGLATERHHRDRFGIPPSSRRSATLRICACCALTAGFAACVASRGWAIGPVAWLALAMAGAAAAFVILNLVPGRDRAKPARSA